MMDSFQDLQNYCLILSASSIRIKEMMDSFQDLQNYCLILSARFVNVIRDTNCHKQFN
ncbi:hypothetical protein J6590_028111 [Homalodisca vitripennis]|nr:hypothetical protein J6590_028109 [Homalodisca vitripennis]KAG8332123.1 hypothetical protein J6590_028110 [Homalodisca vitripennis]KAG8332124.1 hypothetical protein J6590_028111 [Homalodisca vitripennis]